MKKFLLILGALVLVLGLVAAYFVFLYEPKKGTFTISKETTYVLGPVRADGHIDYAEALDALSREGATSENNAHVLFVQALGPKPESATLSDAYFKRLGIDRLPANGGYLIRLEAFLKKQAKPIDKRTLLEWEQSLYVRPWTAEQRPDAAAWLSANAKPLGLVRQGSLRPRYYSPGLFSESAKEYPGLLAILLPTVQPMRELGKALCAQAMLSLGEGRSAEAREDLLASFRMCRLLAQGPTLIESLVAYAISNETATAAQAWLEDPRVTAAEVKEFQDGLESLPPFPPLADRIDRGERFMLLDSILLRALQRVDVLEKLAGRSKAPKASALDDKLDSYHLSGLDWDIALKDGNAWFDRLAAAMRIDESPKRAAALLALDIEAQKIGKEVGEHFNTGGWGSYKGRAQATGELLISVMSPAVYSIQLTADKQEQRRRNLQTAVALARHQRETGRYPEKLDELAPRFIKAVPTDLFSGKELLYRRTEDGYLLHSVGPNQKDDGGKTREDMPYCDDLPNRMPLPPLKKL